jgi:hypothetical protein
MRLIKLPQYSKAIREIGRAFPQAQTPKGRMIAHPAFQIVSETWP